MTEYVRLASELLAGILLAFGLYSFFDSSGTRLHFFTMVIYAALLIPSLIILRALWRVSQDMIRWLSPKGIGNQSIVRRTVIIGAEKQCILYLNSYVHNDHGSSGSVQLVAILDDDSNLHRRYVHGIKVHGGLKLLRNTIRKEKIDQIILTIDLEEEQQAELISIVHEENISLMKSSMLLEEMVTD